MARKIYFILTHSQNRIKQRVKYFSGTVSALLVATIGYKLVPKIMYPFVKADLIIFTMVRGGGGGGATQNNNVYAISKKNGCNPNICTDLPYTVRQESLESPTNQCTVRGHLSCANSLAHHKTKISNEYDRLGRIRTVTHYY